MKITHPVDEFSGHVAVGDYGLHFLAGEAHDTNIPGPVRTAMEKDGFEFTDDRPGRGNDSDDDSTDE